MQRKKAKIKVLHFIPGFLYGGIESLYLMWYKNIDKSIFDFELLIRTQDDTVSTLQTYRQMGGVYHRLQPLVPSAMHKYIKGVRDFFANNHNYDILHAHSEDPFVFYYAKKYGIKHIIIHSHTTSNGKGEKFLIIKSLLSLMSKPFPTQKFACSQLAANWKFGKGSKAVIIPNSVEVNDFRFHSQIRTQYRQELGIEDNYVIGNVGRMTYQKNHPFILDIFKEFLSIEPKGRLLIVGNGPEWDGAIEKSKQLGIESRVLFLGSRSDIAPLLGAMDMFLLPSHYEGLPVTIVEAQTSGLPCVISSVVTDEVCITDLITKVSLKNDATHWAEIIHNSISTKRNREIYYNQVQGSLFNIDNSVGMLEHNYRQQLQKSKL